MAKTKQPKPEMTVLAPAEEEPSVPMEAQVLPSSSPNSQVEVASTAARDTAFSIISGVTTEELKQALVIQTEQRALIQQFIKNNLVVDIDYGRIHVVKNCAAEEKQRGSCNRDYHFSKSILFKPGQEKIFSLFGITDETERDLEAYEMLPNVSGLVAYKCVMYRGNKRIGEGRGAATLAGTQNDPNSTIKKAEKRARMDACLSLGFSAYFTQDLDDPEYASQREYANSKAAAEAERRDKDEFGLMPRDPNSTISDEEREVLYRLTLKAGFKGSEIVQLLKLNGVTDPSNMSSGQARDMMSKIKTNAFAAPEVRQDAVATDTDLQLPDLPDYVPEANVSAEQTFQEPPLVVDDDFKEHVVELLNSIGLSQRGFLWFKRSVSGKPFGDIKDFDEDSWRRAYDFVQGMLDGHIQVDDVYIAGLVNDNKPNHQTVIDPSQPLKDQVPEAEKE